MEPTTFAKYSKENIQFFAENESSALLKKAIEEQNPITLVDLGCGDGKTLFSLHQQGITQKNTSMIGVDLSEERIHRLTSTLPFVKGIVSDALSVKNLSDSSVDFLICTQVIEHVDDKKLLGEIKRILSSDKVAYISTVIRKKYGFYVYFKDGTFKLDPTHLREYESEMQLRTLLKSQGFEVLAFTSKNVSFSILDILLRLLKRAGVPISSNVYLIHPKLRKFRLIKIPVVGYETCEMLVKNQK